MVLFAVRINKCLVYRAMFFLLFQYISIVQLKKLKQRISEGKKFVFLSR